MPFLEFPNRPSYHVPMPGATLQPACAHAPRGTDRPAPVVVETPSPDRRLCGDCAKGAGGTPRPLLATRLRQARQDAGLSQEALAAQVGLSRASLACMETGRTHNPGVLYMKAIAEACAVSLDWLVGGTSPPQTQGDESC